MKRIDGKRLAALREKEGWTFEQAAKKLNISRAQLQRLEKGGIKSPRAHTLAEICRGYGVVAEDLLPEQNGSRFAQGPVMEDAHWRPADIETQVSARVSAQAKNSLALVAHRYGVSQTAVVEVAPLLFSIFANESFAERRKHLAEMRASLTQQNEIARSYLGHLSSDVLPRDKQDWALDAEEASISARDLLGRRVEEKSDDDDLSWDENFDHQKDNPFASFLRRRAGDIARAVTFGDDGASFYLMGMFKEVVANPIAAFLCAQGDLAFHAMPKGLLVAGKEEERLEWLRDQASEADRAFLDKFDAKASERSVEGEES